MFAFEPEPEDMDIEQLVERISNDMDILRDKFEEIEEGQDILEFALDRKFPDMRDQRLREVADKPAPPGRPIPDGPFMEDEEVGVDIERLIERFTEVEEHAEEAWKDHIKPAIQKHGIENAKQLEKWIEEEGASKAKRAWKEHIKPGLQSAGHRIKERWGEVEPVIEEKFTAARHKLGEAFGHKEEEEEEELSAVEEVFGKGGTILGTDEEE